MLERFSASADQEVRAVRNTVAASVLIAALAVSGVACDEEDGRKPHRSPADATTSAPTKRKSSGPRQTPTKAKRTVSTTPTPSATPTPTGTAPRPTLTGTPSTPAPSLSSRSGSSTFTPGYKQTTLDPWRRGQCENAGYTDCG